MTVSFKGCGEDEYRDEYFLYKKKPDGRWRTIGCILSSTMVDPDAAPEDVLMLDGERVTIGQTGCFLCQHDEGGDKLVLYYEEIATEAVAVSEHPFER